jgi:hypothetical protein
MLAFDLSDTKDSFLGGVVVAVIVCGIWIYIHTVNREILVMVLFWPILAPKYEVPKYVTLQKLIAKIEHCLNIFLYLYSLVCTFLSYFFPK